MEPEQARESRIIVEREEGGGSSVDHCTPSSVPSSRQPGLATMENPSCTSPLLSGQKPQGTRVHLLRSDHAFDIRIPAKPVPLLLHFLPAAFFLPAVLPFSGAVYCLGGRDDCQYSVGLMLLGITVGFLVLILLYVAVLYAVLYSFQGKDQVLHVDENDFTCTTGFRTTCGKTARILGIQAFHSKALSVQFYMVECVREHDAAGRDSLRNIEAPQNIKEHPAFGSGRLSEAEVVWICEELKDFLNQFNIVLRPSFPPPMARFYLRQLPTPNEDVRDVPATST